MKVVAVRTWLLVGVLLSGYSISSVVSFIDVSQYGAVGDGVTDDTSAIQTAILTAFEPISSKASLKDSGDGSCTSPPLSVYFPAGFFVVSSSLKIPMGGSVPGFELYGAGHASNILWSFDGDLMVFNDSSASAITGAFVHDIAINSISEMSSTSTALNFVNGCAKSQFSNILFRGQETIPGLNLATTFFPTGIDLGPVSDTTTVMNCIFWFIKGTGILIGQGSEVRIIGGRIVGGAQNYTGFGKDNIGVHVTGNNGGVHVLSSDIIALYEGMRLDSSKTGGVSNREIFITHATFDSNFRGLSIYDNSYVSIAGCWAASSTADNIYMAPTASNALVSVSGGTIFNSGVGGTANSSQGNGFTSYAGSFTLSGVEIRNNVGKGIWVADGSVSEYAITGNKIYGNGMGLDLADSGGAYSVVGNILSRNDQASDYGPQSDGSVVGPNVDRSSIHKERKSENRARK